MSLSAIVCRVECALAKHLGIVVERLDLDYFDSATNILYYSISKRGELYWDLDSVKIDKLLKLTNDEFGMLHNCLVGDKNAK